MCAREVEHAAWLLIATATVRWLVRKISGATVASFADNRHDGAKRVLDKAEGLFALQARQVSK
jgi:hypothetical protein